MKKLALAAVIFSGLATVAITPAQAHDTSAAGFTCGFGSSDDPTGTIANPGTQVGEIDAGPVAVAVLPDIDDTTTPPTIDPSHAIAGNPASATILCDIQVNAPTHAGANAAHAENTGTVVVYLPPTVISYQAVATDDVYMCTAWVLTHTGGAPETLYLDDATGDFLTDPTVATCSLAISQEVPPQEVYDTLCPIAANVPEVYNEVCV